MSTVQTILWVFAGICFFLRTIGISAERTDLGWLGALLIVIAVLAG